MNGLLHRLLPKNLLEWLIFIAVAGAYGIWMTQLLLAAETIPKAGVETEWSAIERIAAFPFFYMGVDPLTGLAFNSLLWGWGFAKLLGLVITALQKS